MDKKIAICFYGQTRTANVLKETYSNMPDIDFFVSTWDDFNNKEVFSFCKDKEFINPRINQFDNNTHRAAYLINRVNFLKSNYEINYRFIYDYVMWTRSEIGYNKNDLYEFFNKIENNDDISIFSDIEKDKDNNFYLPADYSFFSSSHIFDIYATGYKNKAILEKANLKNGGHNYHAYNIINNHLNVKQITLNHIFQFNKRTKRTIDE